MPNPSTDVPPSATARTLRWVKTNPTLHAVVIVVLAVGIVVASVAGVVARRGVERRAAAARTELQRSATAALAAQTSALLRLTALPLGWAFRSALLKDDLTAIDTYLRRMVQEPHVSGVALVGTDGMISHASDQKLRGRPAQKAFPQAALDGQSPTSVVTEHDVEIVVPIMGYDRRLGTLIFSYLLPAPHEGPS